MFDRLGGSDGPLSAAALATLVARLSQTTPGVDDAERIDRIRALEELKAAAAAAQAREVAAFAASQEAGQRARGMRADEVGRGIAAQVGLAMRASHHAARRFTGYARVLVAELPHTQAALARGATTERRALLVAQHTIWLSAQDRAAVDAHIGPRLAALGDRQVEATVRKLAYQLDKAGYVDRQRRAESGRCVSVRPAPDTMAYLTALLPVASAVACQVRLGTVADTLKAVGDARSRGQLMADLLVDAVTGRHPSSGLPPHDHPSSGLPPHDHPSSGLPPHDHPSSGLPPHDHPDAVNPGAVDVERFAGLPAGVGVEIKLVMTDLALFGGGDEPAHLDGYGPVPAIWVRDLLRQRDDSARVWLRRLFTAADTGALAGIETHRREFTGALRELLITRDQFCRQPWCGAPIRHLDHARAHADGGATNLTNGQGLCEACNYAKQAPGWQAETGTDPADPHIVHITTPTGHHYTSRAPDPPGRTRHPPRRAAPPVRGEEPHITQWGPSVRRRRRPQGARQ